MERKNLNEKLKSDMIGRRIKLTIHINIKTDNTS
jgi:hypothetical protein